MPQIPAVRQVAKFLHGAATEERSNEVARLRLASRNEQHGAHYRYESRIARKWRALIEAPCSPSKKGEPEYREQVGIEGVNAR